MKLHLPQFMLAITAAGFLAGTALAQVQKAGDMLVDVDATKLAEGPLSTLANQGTLGGLFEATGGPGTIPTVAMEGGTKGLRFDGSDYLQLVSAAGGSLILAPAGIVGESPTRSIEVWAFNPEVAGDETMVAWGQRGGPDGSNMAFGYGSDFRWGAVGHWGGDGPDLGWNNAGGNPPPGQWHHLVYTFDGAMTRVYADGALANFEVVAEGIINTYPDTPINIGSQTAPDGVTAFPDARGALTIGRVRIHDGVLTAEQIAGNYNLEKAEFIDPLPPAPIAPARLTAPPVHRYSFSEPAAPNASNLEFRDSIGSAHGRILGTGAILTGSRLRLAGGPSSSAAYGDLPNGLISTHSRSTGGSGEVTVELWVKVTGSRAWSRIFDFGSTTTEDGTGELTGPGGGGTGGDYLMYTAQIGDNTSSRRAEVRNEDPPGGGVVSADVSTATFNTDTHIAVTWNESTGQVVVYENGVRGGSFITDDPFSEINDVNIWLGRSNWTADQNLQGEFDEVRLYDRVLSPGEVMGNYQAGPDTFNNTDTPVTIAAQPESRTVPETLPVTFRAGTQGSTPISYQWLRNGTPIPGATEPTYSLESVSAADNDVAFAVEVSNTVAGSPVRVTSDPARLTVVSDPVTLLHRYSFNETSGTTATDSVGAAHGTLLGAGFFEGGRLTLDGSDGTYVDLPNGLVTGMGTNGTFEFWVTYDGGPPWSRVFDFGISTDGEDATGTGLDFIFFTPKTAQGFPRFEANFPNQEGTTFLVHPGSMIPGVEEHIAVTYSALGNVARIYVNGELAGSAPAPIPLSAMNGADRNVWLGRSQFNDAFFSGQYNEFRFYQGAMTPAQVAASFAAGPDALPSTSPPPAIGLQLSAGNLVLTWPETAPGFQLEASPVLGPGATWTRVSDGSPAAGGVFRATVPIDQTARFLRLRQL